MTGAKGLLRHIQSGDLGGSFTPRDAQRKGWQFLTTREDISDAMDVLEEYGWVRQQVVHTGGRPSIHIEVHPMKNEFTP